MNQTPSTFSKKAMLGFLAFAYGWTWFFWTVASVLGETIWSPPAVYFFVIGGLGVPLGGIVMTQVTSGANGLGDFARRIVDTKRITPSWWALIILLFPVLTLVAGLLARATGATQQPFDLPNAMHSLTHPVSLLGMIAFLGQ